MKFIQTLALLLAGVGSFATSQSSYPFEQLEVRFAGTINERAVYNVSFFVHAVERASLEVRLEDSFPHTILPICNCAWTFEGDLKTRTRFSVDFVADFWFVGPARVVASNEEGVVQSIEGLHLYRSGSGILPYGKIDSDRNRLALRMAGDARTGQTLTIVGERAIPEAMTVVAAAPTAQHAMTGLGGEILIGPFGITPVAPLVRADGAGRFAVQLSVPDNRELHGATFFLQAVSDSFEDSLEPWYLSNGLRVTIGA